MSAAKFCDELINSAKIVVISKTYCPYCVKAKKALESYVGSVISHSDYKVVEIESRPDCDAIQDYMNKLTGGRSVPRVFVNGKFIGGGDDTVRKHKSGEIKKLLGA